MSENEVKKGDKIFVPSSYYISHGEDDFAGGESTVRRIEMGISAGEPCLFVEVEENRGTRYNWTTYLGPKQEQLKKEYAGCVAHPDPDPAGNQPWIQKGDWVNGEIYEGGDIW